MNLTNILNWQYLSMNNNLKSYERLLAAADPAALATYRDDGTGWTALEILCHLRDFEQVFIERAQTIVEQDNGALPFPSPDGLAAERAYSQQNIGDAFTAWQATRAQHIDYLKTRSESDWVRTAVHPTRGILTLFEVACMPVMHDNLHLEQMTRVLAEKKS
jgi:hypothetical protein